MTRFTVVWMPEAIDDLAECWLQSPNRDEVSLAANTLEVELSTDPGLKGKELHEDLRSLKVPPLKGIYWVREDDRVAEVLRVRLT